MTGLVEKPFPKMILGYFDVIFILMSPEKKTFCLALYVGSQLVGPVKNGTADNIRLVIKERGKETKDFNQACAYIREALERFNIEERNVLRDVAVKLEDPRGLSSLANWTTSNGSLRQMLEREQELFVFQGNEPVYY